MRHTWRVRSPRFAVLMAGGVLLVTGCSNGGSPVVQSGPSTVPPSVTTSTASTAPATTVVAAKTQQVTVTPDTGLRSPQIVAVSASGFSADESLVVIECAAKGNSTGSSDCNMTGLQAVTSDASGKVDLQFTVAKGPFGSDNTICSATQPCLVSVTQAAPSPTQEADAPITFG